ncbi:hypothetical protein GTP58_08935 [Duganella sp. CY15W]|nr:hypothetical protein [Duganella sp. CY15W]MYM28449.1 hypothetical protein [Duganella sp. CY15W]
MSFSRTAIIPGLSGVLALAKLLAHAFVAISGIFISLGALARRRRHGL